MKKILNKWWVLPLVVGLFYLGKYIYQLPKYDDGERAPNFEWVTDSGEKIELSDLNGKFVLLDFWGSWCGPCRKNFPDLKNLYEKYHDAKFKNADGFEIVSIGIERSESSWKNTIQKSGLNWKHHIFDPATNFKFFDSKIATQYKITSVPTKYLLNENGVVIGVNLPMEKIDKLLAAEM